MINIIGLHGITLFHAPEKKISIQLNSKSLNPWLIYNHLKKTYSLRSNDFTIIGYTPNLLSTKAIKKIIHKQKKILLKLILYYL